MLTKANQVLKRVLFAAFTLAVLAGVVTHGQAFFGGYFDKIAYKADSYDREIKYELIMVMHERGKEPTYRVKIGGTTYEVTEDVWQTYLGEDYNIITYHVETITLYNYTRFGTYFTKMSLQQNFYRGSYPWEKPAQPFTDEDIQTLVNDIYANKRWCDVVFQSDTTVEFSSTSRGSSGQSIDYYLENGAIRCKNPEINWWWNWFI